MFALPKEAEQKIERNRFLMDMVGSGALEIIVVSTQDANYIASMQILLDLRNIFQKQLPNMPKEYVTRLLFDMKHRSMAIIEKKENKVVGGICYRLFYEDSFAEIVFCAVNSDSQIRGYGEFMMSMLKKTVASDFAETAAMKKEEFSGPIYLLTYADNYAIGYFKKQGFTKQITFINWKGRIKDYEGGTLMQGKILPEVEYKDIYKMLIERREKLQKIAKKAYPGMHKEYVLPDSAKKVEEIPGLLEAGFTKKIEKSLECKGSLKELLLYLCYELKRHNTSWPFLEPVNMEDVQDYYTVIKHPMDFQTIQRKIEADQYKTFEEMDSDVQLIINNCYTYNPAGSQYAKCAKSLNDFYQDKVQWCRQALSQRR
ncbi:histone acetyltransferase [Nematocida minor]|uniref:histone acetyltransferase n=1 Tax=Nematocida minor TaxID=1912983 RepID=UPI002220A597|nr:histone acetyltransferase [Nematocida minor]XP_051332113.1 histone acetyltransferase [Nematocida minor]KAI5188843.1 histone acetyltransferase [Nematocida minor]KAI5188947.1 histone acetyltransferase [Nematocida minor]